MEVARWEKDESPYLVFTCSKCKQYIYVKTSQKTKKCLRCGRQHQVKNITWGEEVKGMSAAVLTVKERQNQLAITEMGISPDLRSIDDFHIYRSTKRETEPKKEKDLCETAEGEEYFRIFKEGLEELSKKYKEFPEYLIEIMVEDLRIPNQEVYKLIHEFEKNGILTRLNNNHFKIKDVK